MVMLTDPAHPGQVLKELYLDPLNMSAAALAGRIEMPSAPLAHIVRGDEPMTAEIALRLARFLATTPEYWMNLQRDYDLAQARKRVDVGRIVPVEME